ncbi:hypothetical protein [Bacteroides graminisolvens]|uniref:hypothetical protein n=1 Tax=Bacteroides graminisolvens TaxID=477666 RepID=UPI000484B350|nr:hypothetical protein [Bacteroides graminisolvens]
MAGTAYGTAKKPTMTPTAALPKTEKTQKTAGDNQKNPVKEQAAHGKATTKNTTPTPSTTIRRRTTGKRKTTKHPIQATEPTTVQQNSTSIKTAETKTKTKHKEPTTKAMNGARGAKGLTRKTKNKPKAKEEAAKVEAKEATNARPTPNKHRRKNTTTK